ncbi:MAG: anhydro-N-acetylmuramic acid kinase [Candidatus Caenarcaniphilales bacterium]|nr:anhydro-N-acetylmuramic acid kinase [Candidatus Caenarcaniphilales bacterium]
MLVLGINTGTSVDGVDLALVDWDVSDIKNFRVIKEESYQFDPSVKKDILVLIGMQKANLEDISNLHFRYSKFLASLVRDFQAEIPEHKIDLIGMHGQTIFHGKESTWQIGSPSVIAKLTGIMTIGDFRTGDMAVGGCGAPLTSFFDETLIRRADECIATLNIGGIANITVMEPGKATIAYDTGPGNTLIDVLIKKLFQKDFDEDGQIAYKGKVDDKFASYMINRTEYFSLEAPKATGRELFCEKYADKFLDLGNKENIISTTSYFTALTIANELKKYPITKVYVSGGGIKNKFIMDYLYQLNPGINFKSHDEFKIKEQYKEAMLFSLLGFSCYQDIPANIPSSTGAKKATILGIIAKP